MMLLKLKIVGLVIGLLSLNVGFAQIPVTDVAANGGIQAGNTQIMVGNQIQQYISMVQNQKYQWEKMIEQTKKKVDYITESRSFDDVLNMLNNTSCILIDIDANWSYVKPFVDCYFNYELEIAMTSIAQAEDFMDNSLDTNTSMEKEERLMIFGKAMELYDSGQQKINRVNKNLQTMADQQELKNKNEAALKAAFVW